MYYTAIGRYFSAPKGVKTGHGSVIPEIGIAYAESRDGIRWEKHAANPVLRADPRYYEPHIPREATYQEKDFGTACSEFAAYVELVPAADDPSGVRDQLLELDRAWHCASW